MAGGFGGSLSNSDDHSALSHMGIHIDHDRPKEPWPGLAMSRVIGHTGVNAIGVIPEPDVQSFTITTDDRCLIIASDGIWDFVDEDEAVDMVRESAPDAEAACRMLVETASQRWIEDDPTYRDDISAVVIYLPLTGSAVSASVSYTSDSVTAKKAAAKPAPVEESEPAPAKEEEQPDFFRQFSNFISGGRGAESPPAARPPAGAAAPAAADAGAPAPAPKAASPPKKKKEEIKATKEQRRKSVVTLYG